MLERENREASKSVVKALNWWARCFFRSTCPLRKIFKVTIQAQIELPPRHTIVPFYELVILQAMCLPAPSGLQGPGQSRSPQLPVAMNVFITEQSTPLYKILKQKGWYII